MIFLSFFFTFHVPPGVEGHHEMPPFGSCLFSSFFFLGFRMIV